MSRVTKSGAKPSKASAHDKALDQILRARPYMSKKQMHAIESGAGGNGIGLARRIGLGILTQSVPHLRKHITKDDTAAAAFAGAHARLLWLIARQKELTEMMEAAHIRLLAAFTDRPDAEQLMDAAEKEFSRPN